MKRHAVHDAHQEERPVGSAFRHRGIPIIVDGEKDVGDFGEVGQSFAKAERIGCLNQHERHGGT